MLEDIYLASGLVILLENVLILLINLLSRVCCLHSALKCLDFVTLHIFKLLALEVILLLGKLPGSLDLVNLDHDLPAEGFSKFSHQALHLDLIQRQWILR